MTKHTNNNSPETLEVYIVAITFPTPSNKYGETSCTAGIDKNGNWVRLYPIPLRIMQNAGMNNSVYRKYQWIKVETFPPSNGDRRPESRKCVYENIELLSKTPDGTSNNWEQRKSIVLKSNSGIFTDFSELLEQAKEMKLSLAVFKPQKVHRCIIKTRSEEDVKSILKKQQNIERKMEQDFFIEYKDFSAAEPMLLDVKYEFEDCNGTRHTVGIIDWEVYELFRKCYKESGSLEYAKQKVFQKYNDEFIASKDLYFIMGTRKEDHLKGFGQNPFSIIGVFYPLKKEPEKQLYLDL